MLRYAVDLLILFGSWIERGLLRLRLRHLMCCRLLPLRHGRRPSSYGYDLLLAAWLLRLLLHGHALELHHLLLLRIRSPLRELHMTLCLVLSHGLAHMLQMLGYIPLHIHLLPHSSRLLGSHLVDVRQFILTLLLVRVLARSARNYTQSERRAYPITAFGERFALKAHSKV